MIFFCLQTLDSFPFIFLFTIRKNKFLSDILCFMQFLILHRLPFVRLPVPHPN